MPNANNFCKPAVPPMVMERWGGLLSLQDDGETLNLIFCGIDLGPAFDFDMTGWEGTWFTFHAWFMCLYDFKGSWLPLFAVLLWMIWLRLSMKKAVSDSGDATCLQIISIHGCNGWNGLGGWMDGWVDGWMMDGWVDGWMDDGRMNKPMYEWVIEGMNESTNDWMDGCVGWNGMERNGMEWNGLEWNGMDGWNGMERMEWNHGWMEPKECLASDWRNGWTTEINKSFFVDNMRTRGGPQHHVTISNQTIMSNSKFETSKCIWNIKMHGSGFCVHFPKPRWLSNRLVRSFPERFPNPFAACILTSEQPFAWPLGSWPM